MQDSSGKAPTNQQLHKSCQQMYLKTFKEVMDIVAEAHVTSKVPPKRVQYSVLI